MIDKAVKISLTLMLFFALGACSTVPTGPSMLVLPGTGKSFTQFRVDDVECRQFASTQVGDSAVSSAAVNSAVVGTVLGAVAGAAIDGSRGAGVGAGTGLLIGSTAGLGTAGSSSYGMQRRYDFSYQQCMYAKGHRVPVTGSFVTQQNRQSTYVTPSGNPPPPPNALPPQ